MLLRVSGGVPTPVNGTPCLKGILRHVHPTWVTHTWAPETAAFDSLACRAKEVFGSNCEEL